MPDVFLRECADVVERDQGFCKHNEIEHERQHEKQDLLAARDHAALEGIGVALCNHVRDFSEHGCGDGHREEGVGEGEPQARVRNDGRTIVKAAVSG